MKSNPKKTQKQHDIPVTVSVSRRIRPGREADYEAWIHGITEVANRYEGNQGINILRPSTATGGRYVLIYRFDSEEHARAWEESPEKALWLERLEGISDGEADLKRVSGLEVWFELPEVPSSAQAPRYKMALVLITVVFCLVLPLQLFLVPQLSGWPRWSQILVVVVLQVLSMTYIFMPVVTALLKPWLFRNVTSKVGSS